MKKYDYLLVGGGLFSAVFAYRAAENGKKCLVIEKRPHLGGNIYCEDVCGIHVHKYGAHIFHTSNKRVWEFVNSLAEFNRYTNCPVACYKGEMYNMPFNMNTFSKMFGISTPKQAAEVPLAIARASYKVLQLAHRLVIIGNPGVITDGACSALLARAALRCAEYNVRINLGLTKDEEYNHGVQAELNNLLKNAEELEAGALALTDKVLE